MTNPVNPAESIASDLPTDKYPRRSGEESHQSGIPRADSLRSPSNTLRAAALTLALVPSVLLLVAGRLQPSAAGLGTHQQLGLPPCTTRVMFGIRCPGCGMTTSWSHFVRGQWKTSVAVNLGGFLLAIYSLTFIGLAISVVKSGRIPPMAVQRVYGTTLIAIFAITITDWIWRLTIG